MTAQLESLCFCISLDYLMTLQDFFVSGLPTGNNEAKPKIEHAITTDENRPKPDRQVSTATTKTTTSAAKGIHRLLDAKKRKPSILATTTVPDADVETRLKVCVKNPEIILLEDQHNANSNCLVLDVSLSYGSFKSKTKKNIF